MMRSRLRSWGSHEPKLDSGPFCVAVTVRTPAADTEAHSISTSVNARNSPPLGGRPSA